MYNDHLGSPVAAETTSGSLVFRRITHQFGEKRQDRHNCTTTRALPGTSPTQKRASPTCRHAITIPVIGRFLSNDPVGFTPAVPQMHNRYAYTLNDPINFIDPGGRDAVRVRFADQKIGIPDTDRDFYQFVSRGHSGSLIIRSDGLNKYREYGRVSRRRHRRRSGSQITDNDQHFVCQRNTVGRQPKICIHRTSRNRRSGG